MKNIVLRRKIAHREYSAYGINAEMFACLKKTNWLNIIMKNDDENENLLFRAIVSDNFAERVMCGKKSIQNIWKQLVPFGPYQLIDLLSEFEFDRKFYSGHRDHVTHQLKVFLLGLYIYENCSEIKKCINEKHGGHEGFLLRWVLCSLFHDLGYVFEIGDASDHAHVQQTITALNNIYFDPFNDFINWKYGSVLLPAQE